MYSHTTQQTKFCQAKTFLSYFWQFKNWREDFTYSSFENLPNLIEVNAFLATQTEEYLMSHFLILKEIQSDLVPVYQAKLINYFKSLEIAFRENLKIKLS